MTASNSIRKRQDILGVPIDVITWSEAIGRITTWAAARASRVVFICNVHTVITARESPTFAAALESADMATPDGAPIAWLLRRAGYVNQERINGPDLMWGCCRKAA